MTVVRRRSHARPVYSLTRGFVSLSSILQYYACVICCIRDPFLLISFPFQFSAFSFPFHPFPLSRYFTHEIAFHGIFMESRHLAIFIPRKCHNANFMVLVHQIMTFSCSSHGVIMAYSISSACLDVKNLAR